MTINADGVPKKTLPISYDDPLLKIERPTTIKTRLSRYIHDTKCSLQFTKYCIQTDTGLNIFWQIFDRGIILSGAELLALGFHWLGDETENDWSVPEWLRKTQFFVVIVVYFRFERGEPSRELEYFAFDLICIERSACLLDDKRERESVKDVHSEQLTLEDLKNVITALRQQSSQLILQACFLEKSAILARVVPTHESMSQFNCWKTDYPGKQVSKKDWWYRSLVAAAEWLSILMIRSSWKPSSSESSKIDIFEEDKFDHKVDLWRLGCLVRAEPVPLAAPSIDS